jgi:hypothetical protein
VAAHWRNRKKGQAVEDKKDESDNFERLFFSVFDEAREKKKVSVAELARRLDPDASEIQRRIYYARKGTTASGIPQRIPLAEAHRMCRAIGVDLAIIIVRTEAALISETEDIPEGAPPGKKKPDHMDIP